jgi:biotin operon repressor
MRTQRRTTIIVAGGALAIASVGYGLGTQADDGTAVADGNQSRDGGPRLMFERGAPPGFNDLADTLGVDADKLEQALRDFRDEQRAGMRADLSNALADALGIDADKVRAALDDLRQRHESRFANRLAKALGADADDVKAALDKLRDDGPVRFGDFATELADELGLDEGDVREALMETRPPRGGPHVRHALPLRQLASALDVSRSDLRKAFQELRRNAADEFEQRGKELAEFLADRFNLDVDTVLDALPAIAPPLSSPHRAGLPHHPPAP